MKKKILFIDRDGTLILDPPPSYQVDRFPKLEFYPHVFEYLTKISKELDFILVMITNQDGLGTDVFPEDTFWEPQNFIVRTFENEGIHFDNIFIDRTFAHENKPTRKPGTALLKDYIEDENVDMQNSFVIGDRITDVLLAKNLGCKAFFLNNKKNLGAHEIEETVHDLQDVIALETTEWKDIYTFLSSRKCDHHRKTNETDISVSINLDGSGESDIQTGLNFFDHMLDQLSRHGGLDLSIHCKGDLHVDEHHTIEDTAIALGEVFVCALGNKRGMERYGFTLPMDDAQAAVSIDFGGRNWIEWNVDFKREKIGDVPTEMFFHFFKSFSDAAHCNLHIAVTGENEHHKIEAIFKAFAKAIKMAVKRDPKNNSLPSTKGVL